MENTSAAPEETKSEPKKKMPEYSNEEALRRLKMASEVIEGLNIAGAREAIAFSVAMVFPRKEEGALRILHKTVGPSAMTHEVWAEVFDKIADGRRKARDGIVDGEHEILEDNGGTDDEHRAGEEVEVSDAQVTEASGRLLCRVVPPEPQEAVPEPVEESKSLCHCKEIQIGIAEAPCAIHGMDLVEDRPA